MLCVQEQDGQLQRPLRSEVRGPSVREHAGPEGADAAEDMSLALSERTTNHATGTRGHGRTRGYAWTHDAPADA